MIDVSKIRVDEQGRIVCPTCGKYALHNSITQGTTEQRWYCDRCRPKGQPKPAPEVKAE